MTSTKDSHPLSRQPPKVFLREATGLVRQFSRFDGIVMAFAYFNIASSIFVVIGWGSWLFPGADMGVSIGLVGLLVDLPILVAYSFFAMGMPRSGGDYVYVSRLSPPIGFAVAVVFLVYLIAFAVGQNAWFTVVTALAPSLAVIGSVTGNSALLNLSSFVVRPDISTILGLILMVVVFLLLLVPTSILHKIMMVLFAVAFLGYPILYGAQLALSSNAQFIIAFNNHAAAYGTSYSGIIQSAAEAGAQVVPRSIMASLGALPIVYATLAFPSAVVYVGGEVKNATKQVPQSLIIGLFGIAFVWIIVAYLTYNVFGYKFIEAAAFYGFSGASGYPLPAAPFPNYFVGILNPNPLFTWVLLISAVAWEFLLMITYQLMSSRAIFALAFDSLIPRGLADINERSHTPIKANFVGCIIAVVFLVLTSYNFLGTYVAGIVGWTSAYLIVMISAALFPFARKELFQQFPAYARKRIGGIPAMSIAGVLGSLSLLIVFYYLMGNPAVSGASAAGLAIVAGIYVIFIVTYYVVKAYRKRQGLDLSLVFKEIPPE